MDQMTEALSSNENSRSTISDTDEHLAVKTDEHPVVKSSPPDETVYETYAAVLASIQDAYEGKIIKAQKSEQWFQERRAEANEVVRQLGGTAKSAHLPPIPSENTVANELGKAKQKLSELQQVEYEITQHQAAISKKQEEIDKRNNRLTIGAVVYVIGVVLVGAGTGNWGAAFLWPLVAAIVVVVLGVIFIFGGGGG